MEGIKKVVVNKCYGGFSLSPEAALWLYERGMKELATPIDEYWTKEFYKNETERQERIENDLNKWRTYQAKKKQEHFMFVTVFSPDEKYVLDTRPKNREHPLLIECVETLKEKANGPCAKLEITEIPVDVNYQIEEYDGQEWIAEVHKTW